MTIILVTVIFILWNGSATFEVMSFSNDETERNTFLQTLENSVGFDLCTS